MKIRVVPAVDISKGKCVRLTKGRIDESKVYYDDPLEAARRWEGEGAEWIHVVDLDAAVGVGNNAEQVKRIIANTGVEVEVGGGVRSLEAAREYIGAGAGRIILGTGALDANLVRASIKEFGAEKVMAAVDHIGGRVAVKGWKEMVGIDAALLCRRLEDLGVRIFMMTSIDRDGTMKGPNIEYSLMAVSEIRGEVYLAGGFSSLSDLAVLRGSRAAGVILGKALYEGAFTLKEAMGVVG
ncbi:MAG: 1-(5-phosphoribosyl)-5-[(5-phosphoribosylamino)methylideneamino]imidazole-4-carboxamide isomerase [Candidatus Verstraetearchaeota archaeon]|nr:1-(5-phosphoribosyl)-5-[(5-phosphoribosylamino)methylideneamino]imidazole-4-carboxamide isomerase [Candidatus Verstraetearchaeota archaeon]